MNSSEKSKNFPGNLGEKFQDLVEDFLGGEFRAELDKLFPENSFQKFFTQIFLKFSQDFPPNFFQNFSPKLSSNSPQKLFSEIFHPEFPSNFSQKFPQIFSTKFPTIFFVPPPRAIFFHRKTFPKNLSNFSHKKFQTFSLNFFKTFFSDFSRQISPPKISPKIFRNFFQKKLPKNSSEIIFSAAPRGPRLFSARAVSGFQGCVSPRKISSRNRPRTGKSAPKLSPRSPDRGG